MYRHLKSILALGALAVLALFAMRTPAWAAASSSPPHSYRLRLFTAPAWCGVCRQQEALIGSLRPLDGFDAAGRAIRYLEVTVEGRVHRVVLDIRDIDIESNAEMFDVRASSAVGVPYYQLLVDGHVTRANDEAFPNSEDLLRFLRRGIAPTHAWVLPPASNEYPFEDRPEYEGYDPNALLAFHSSPLSEYDPRRAGPVPPGLVEQAVSPRIDPVLTTIAL